MCHLTPTHTHSHPATPHPNPTPLTYTSYDIWLLNIHVRSIDWNNAVICHEYAIISMPQSKLCASVLISFSLLYPYFDDNCSR